LDYSSIDIAFNQINPPPTKEAILSLEKSHSRSPDNQGVNCVLATAYMNDARDLAYFGNVDESKNR
jgi:hypothetical protein